MFNINFLRKTETPNAGISIGGKNTKLVIGLGNPGEKYKNTYHNIGAMFVDFLYDNSEETDGSTKWKTVKSFTYTKAGGVVLAKTGTYMNRSGKSVTELLRYFKMHPEEIIIVHDDADIPLGSYKISYGRGSAGHNGIESITKLMKGNEFLRLRIGIRHGNEKAGDFVLKKIKGEHLRTLTNLFREIKSAEFKV